jgi:hypothetical protein
VTNVATRPTPPPQNGAPAGASYLARARGLALYIYISSPSISRLPVLSNRRRKCPLCAERQQRARYLRADKRWRVGRADAGEGVAHRAG